MTTWTLYHNPNCSKSREALAFLQEQSDITLHIVEYLKTPLSTDTLSVLTSELTSALPTLVRTKEEAFTASPFNVNSTADVIENLIKNPKLLERPILHGNNKAVIGRPLEKIKEALALS